jgi:hypothetical protein
VPLPSVVWFPEVVGPDDVLQHTPLAVTVAPPSEVTIPPLVAVFWAISVTGDVVTTGKVALGKVENCNSLPYPVPTLFVA